MKAEYDFSKGKREDALMKEPPTEPGFVTRPSSIRRCASISTGERRRSKKLRRIVREEIRGPKASQLGRGRRTRFFGSREVPLVLSARS